MPDPRRRSYERRTVSSDPAQFRGVRRWLARIARETVRDERWIRRLVLAIHEALTNSHRHAYAGRTDGRIDVCVVREDGRFEVRVRDYGNARAEGAYAGPIPDGASDRGGYGIHLMRVSVDRLAIAPAGEGTEVILDKTVPAIERDAPGLPERHDEHP